MSTEMFTLNGVLNLLFFFVLKQRIYGKLDPLANKSVFKFMITY